MHNLKVTNMAISWKGDFDCKKTKKAFENIISTQLIKPNLVKYYANFAVVRYRQVKFVYIIFYSGHVNCTGVSNPNFIAIALKVFKQSYSIPIHSFKIKAIAATTKFNLKFLPEYINHILSESNNALYKLSIVSNRFTGLMFRFKIGGSVQVFYSGKTNFLGARDFSHLNYMNDFVRAILCQIIVPTPPQNT